MASNPPLLIVDNVFDRINCYPNAVITSAAAAVGREAPYAFDYRRERSYFQPAAAATGNGILADIGAGNTRAVDSVWIDRGHNLWGKTVVVVSDTDGTYGGGVTTRTLTVPASTVIGGDPTSSTMCVTEEGALYSLFSATPARRYFGIWINESWQPILTGVIVGARSQLLVYSSKLDEDAGGRVQRTQESDAGYSATDRVYAYRTVDLVLSLIGATEYDATIRYLRRMLFEINQPAFIVMNYGAKPERGWLYQYSPNNWSAPTQRVYRSTTIQMRELGPLIR